MKFLSVPLSLLGLLAVSSAFVVGCSTDPGDGDDPSGTSGDPGSSSGGQATGGLGSGGESASGGSSTGGSSGGASGSGGSATSSGGMSAIGTGGGAPAAGGTGSGGSGSTEVEMSEGCGVASSQQAGMWTTSSVSSGEANRNYDTRLPGGYDADTAYPVILLLHGCGNPTNNVPMEQVAGEDAIIVRGTGSKDGCWHETASGADLPYLDAIMEDVQKRFCVNTEHLFAVGYSSGSWLASTLSCHRGDIYRGIASVAGGEPSGQNGCMGQHGRIFIHDTNDTNNNLEWDTPSRDRMIATNNCTQQTMPFDPSPCVEYQGCDPGYPVVWCQTSGEGHNRQDNLAKEAFWNFFQQLME